MQEATKLTGKMTARWSGLAALGIIMLLTASCGGGTVTITPGGGQAPTVFISGIDQNEEIFTNHQITVTASDADGTVSRLRVYVDGSQIFSDTYHQFHVTENFTVFGDSASAGWHTIEAVVTDDEGNTDHDVVDYQVAP